MKLITFNCNGYRAAYKKGLIDYLEKQDADIVCFQEIKAESKQMDISFFESKGYIPFIHSAQKKGYSGVAIFTKMKPVNSMIGIGNELYDSEGRTILLEFKNFALINTYFPSGTSGEERQAFKMKFLDHYNTKLEEWKLEYGKVIVCGDVNIAHKEIDIHDPKSNEKNSGFLPVEREWLTQFLDRGLVDVFRYMHPDKKDEYSWWTYRFGARSRNKGWRIDYFFVTENWKKKIQSASIHQDFHASDHAPVVVEFNL